MINHFKRPLFALLLVTLVAATGYAQFGGLKKKLEKIAGPAKTDGKPSSDRRVVQYKPGERIAPLTNESLEQFIKAAKAEQAYAAMTSTERARADQQKTAHEEATAAKRSQRDKCVGTLSADVMDMQMQMQMRVMELAQAGDPNPAAKAVDEMQKAVMKLSDTKCGPEIKDDPADLRADFKVEEWICAYTAVRGEKGAAGAGAAVLATENEAKIIEAHLTALQEICADQNKTSAAPR